MNWLTRITEYYKDKNLAEKCGLLTNDICVHEPKQVSYSRCPMGTDMVYTCKKCGEEYR